MRIAKPTLVFIALGCLAVAFCRIQPSPFEDLHQIKGLGRATMVGSTGELLIFVTLEPPSPASYLPTGLQVIGEIAERVSRIPVEERHKIRLVSIVLDAPSERAGINEQFISIDFLTAALTDADFKQLPLDRQLALATRFTAMNGGAARIEAFCGDPHAGGAASAFCRAANASKPALEADTPVLIR